MKTNRIIQFLFLVCAAVCAAYGCKKDNSDDGAGLSVRTVSLTNVTYTSAECSGEVTGNASERGVCWSLSPLPTVSGDKAAAGRGAGTFSVELTGLSEGTVYYVRAYAVDGGGGAVYGRQQTFRTYDKGEPILSVSPADNIRPYQARLKGRLVADGGLAITEMGMCYSADPTPTVDDMKLTVTVNGAGNYSAEAEGLADGETYYVRFYAISSGIIYYSANIVEFTTLEDFPVCVTPTLSDIGDKSMKVSAEAIQSGQREILEWGICWGTSPLPTIDDNKESLGGNGGQAETTITGLTEGTGYYVRTYATTALSTSYSAAAHEQTLLLRPSVETGTVNAAAIYKHKVTVNNCRIVSLGERDLPVERAGICFSHTNQLPTISDEVIDQAVLGVGVMDEMQLQILRPGTTYYARAFATNEIDTGYGQVIEFTTAPENRVLMPDGGAAPTAPNFNALRFYYLPKDEGGSGTPTTGAGEWQQERYDALEAVFNAYGGWHFNYFLILFTSNKVDATIAPTAGTEKYVIVRHYYLNTSGSSITTSFDMKYAVDDLGLYTFSEMNLRDGVTAYNNFTALYNNSAAIKAYMDAYIEYLTTNTFMLEFETPGSASYHLIPIEEPTHYYKFSYARYSGVAYLPVW